MSDKKTLKMVLTVIAITLLAIVVVNNSSRSNASASITPSSPLLEGSFVPNEILIGIRPEIVPTLSTPGNHLNLFGITSLDQLNLKYNVQHISAVFSNLDPADPIVNNHGLSGVYKLTVPLGTDIFAMIDDYQTDHSVLYAEPNRIYMVTDIPSDPDFDKQWALHNTGQTDGRDDADIDAPEAWGIEKGSATVMIAIVDTGVDYNHPDLVGNRIRTDIDRDFVNDDDDAMDDHRHGTYVAGIVAANTNNQVGMAGVCQGCQILPVKVLDSKGSGTAETVAQGIQYAASAGAQIINMSLGFPSNCGCSKTVANAINYAFDRGSLLVAASGNDSDKERLSYPASSPRVLSVGASNHEDHEAAFSNRNSYLDIMAPGKDIYSLDRNNKYYTGSGTSAAAPHVSGVAGLLLSANPHVTNTHLWWILYQSADDFPATANAEMTANPVKLETVDTSSMPFQMFIPSVINLRSTFGRLNAYQALTRSLPGQMHTPVDTCSSDPSCTPGCGAEVILVSETTVVEDLQLLRSFRENVLTPSAIGQYWTSLYEAHRLEVATILATNNQLRNQTTTALNQWLPLIHVLVYPDSDEQATLTNEHFAAIEIVIAGLETKSGAELNVTLAEAKEFLEIGRQFVGMDAREAWSQIQD